MREIVFDTETTGLDPYQGDRLVDVACVGLLSAFGIVCAVSALPGRRIG